MKRNPLLRGSDRFETWMLLGLFAVFILGAPVLAWWTAGMAYHAELRAVEWEQRNVFRAEAELIASPQTQPSQHSLRGVWTAPDGTPRTGLIEVTAGHEPGDRVTIWVNAGGDLRSEPSGRNPVGQAALVAAVAVGVVAVAVNQLRRLCMVLLDRHRARAWQREWLKVGPRWSRDLRS